MATQTKIMKNIEDTRDNISNIINDLSETVHKRLDVNRMIRENPSNALLTGLAAGFILSTMTTPLGRILFRFSRNLAFTALGTYISGKSVDYISHKMRK